MPDGHDALSWLHIGDLHIAREADGSNADRVGAWPERSIFHTQLGPNRNGRKW